MWNLEKDPYLSSPPFANVTMLDTRARHRPAPRAAWSAPSRIVPRLRQRVSPALGACAAGVATTPTSTSTTTSAASRCRRPATMRELLDLAAQRSRRPVRPHPTALGVRRSSTGSRAAAAAMLQKIHHTHHRRRGRHPPVGAVHRRQPRPPTRNRFRPSSRRARSPATRHLSPPRSTRLDAQPARGASASPSGPSASWPHLARQPAPHRRRERRRRRPSGGPASASSPSPTTPTRRSGPSARCAAASRCSRVPFDDAKRAAKALGGSFNDLFVDRRAGGAGAYHRGRAPSRRAAHRHAGQHPRPTARRAATASPRPGCSSPPAPTRSSGSPRCSERLAGTKQERALRLVQGMAGIVNLLPTSVLVRIARQQVETVDFTTSNVRGAPVRPLHRRGPTSRPTTRSARSPARPSTSRRCPASGMLDMGLHVDLAAIDDPELLRSCLEDSFAELLACC